MEKKYGKIGMDVNSGMNDYFERALRPPAIKEETKKWTTLAGYVYLFAFFSHHKLTKFTRPTRRENAVPVPATWRFVSRSVQDAVRRGKDDAKGEILPAARPRPWVVTAGCPRLLARWRVLQTPSRLGLVRWSL